jgi:hypothetical protein
VRVNVYRRCWRGSSGSLPADVCVFPQVTVKLDETRKFYAVYNMLDRKRQYLIKQVGVRKLSVTAHCGVRPAHRPSLAAILTGFSSRLNGVQFFAIYESAYCVSSLLNALRVSVCVCVCVCVCGVLSP